MKRLLKDQRGFTLIELMIVIAIIGILAAVLVPKMGFVKDTAREAGVMTNKRVVEAQASALIHKYRASEIGDFEEALKNKLGGKLENPFSKDSNVRLVNHNSDSNDPDTPPAVVFDNYISGSDVDEFAEWSSDKRPKIKGAVVFAAYDAGGVLKCQVFYYDNEGNRCPESEMTIVE